MNLLRAFVLFVALFSVGIGLFMNYHNYDPIHYYTLSALLCIWSELIQISEKMIKRVRK